MDKAIKEKWIAALRSGEWKQARRSLKVRNPDGTCSHCCLGVLAEIEGISINSISDPYKGIGRLFGDFAGNPPIASVIDLNDTSKLSFREIADWIEANIPGE